MSIHSRLVVQVSLRRAYGNERFYPNNSLAITLCKLMKTKSMTRKELEICKKAGWEILVAIYPEKFEIV
jgi:hypothetical protein